MRFYILALLVAVPIIPGNAQECTSSLSGTVIDFHDGTALSGALVQTVDGSQTALTDTLGRYLLESLCDGTLELEVSHPQCTSKFVQVTIQGPTEKRITLEHHLEELEEVQVVGETILEKTNSAQEQSLNTQILEQFSVATLGDALREIPGVSSLNTGSNIVKPAIHGLNGSRVLILNDGVRMQDMEWGDEHAPNVDINSAGSVSVIKGASALQYGGDAIGGVILMEPLRVPFQRDTLFGKTLLSGVTNGRGGNVTSEITKAFKNNWFIKGQASYKRLGDQEAPNYLLSNTGVQEIGASIKLGKRRLDWGWDARYAYYNAEIAILRASHIGNVDDLIRSINSGVPGVIRPFTYDLQNPRQKVTHHLGKLSFYKRFEGTGRWNLQYDFQSNQRFEFDVRRGERDDRAALDLLLTTHTLSTDFKWDSKPNFQLTVGALGRYQDNFANPETGVRRLIPDYEKYDLGVFAIAEREMIQGLWWDVGVRYDFTRIDALKFYRSTRWEERGYEMDFQDIIVEDLGTQLLTNPLFDYHNVSATTGLKYRPGQNSTLRFNYALAQRAPNPAELFSDGLHHSAARIELGDLRINQELSHKISLSWERDMDNWGFVLEPFANFIQDFILLEPTGVEFTIRGAFPVWSYRQTNARLLGLDALAYVDWTDRWRTEHRFALVKGTDLESDLALINIPAANLGNSIEFHHPEWFDLELSLESNYVFRQNEFPPNINVFSPEQQQEVLLEINTPPEAYHLLGFNSRMQFPLGGTLKLGTSLTVNNILNTTFRDYLNRQRFFADDLGRNIILQIQLNY